MKKYFEQIKKLFIENEVIAATEVLEFMLADLYCIECTNKLFPLDKTHQPLMKKILATITNRYEAVTTIKTDLTVLFQDVTPEDLPLASTLAELLRVFFACYPDYVSILSPVMLEHMRPVPCGFVPEEELINLLHFLESEHSEVKNYALEAISNLIPFIQAEKISTINWQQILSALATIVTDVDNADAGVTVVEMAEHLLKITSGEEHNTILQFLEQGLSHPSINVVAACVEKLLIYNKILNDEDLVTRIFARLVDLMNSKNVHLKCEVIAIIKNNYAQIPSVILPFIATMLNNFLRFRNINLHKQCIHLLSLIEFSELRGSPESMQEKLSARLQGIENTLDINNKKEGVVFLKYVITLRIIRLLIMSETHNFDEMKIYFINVLLSMRLQNESLQLLVLKMLGRIANFIPVNNPEIQSRLYPTLLHFLKHDNDSLEGEALSAAPRLADRLIHDDKIRLIAELMAYPDDINDFAGIIPDELKVTVFGQVKAMDEVSLRESTLLALICNGEFVLPAALYEEVSQFLVSCNTDKNYNLYLMTVASFAANFSMEVLLSMIETLLNQLDLALQIDASRLKDHLLPLYTGVTVDLIRALAKLANFNTVNQELNEKVVAMLDYLVYADLPLIATTASWCLVELKIMISTDEKCKMVNKLLRKIAMLAACEASSDSDDASEVVNNEFEELLKTLFYLYQLVPEALKITVITTLLFHKKFSEAVYLVVNDKEFDYRPILAITLFETQEKNSLQQINLIIARIQFYQKHISEAQAARVADRAEHCHIPAC